ncbi:MAG TPA: response regulator, partial [Anaeromyxobacteraceae bacterium]
MNPKRVLIVEPDSAFALSLASLFRDDGHQTTLAASAADAEREIAARPPDLVVTRAELPDVSGFSLCARLRKDRGAARLPVVLYSSEASHEALEQHARTPGAANGYLLMPLDTAALLQLAQNLLVMTEPFESADDAIVEDDTIVEVRPGDDAPGEAPPVQRDEAPQPPPVPRRIRRSAITDEDRLFLDRTFRALADRRADLVAESRRPRPPPTRALLATPEGKLQVLRDDLKAREAQIARLAEIWDVRERDVAQVDDRLHEKEVELQGLRLQVDDLLRRLAEARDLFVEKEREHGASIEGLLLEKFGQEKELIEVVAAHERRIHELERELRLREDDLARRKLALDGAAEEIGRLERRLEADAEQFDLREQELQEAQAAREAELAEAERALASARAEADETARRHEARLEEAAAGRRALEAELSSAREEAAAAAREHEARRAELEARAGALAAEVERERERAAGAEAERDVRAAALEARLAGAAGELEASREAAREAAAAFQQRIEEREAAIAEREGRLALLDAEYRAYREAALGREDDLSRELQDHLQQIGALEGEIEAAAAELAEREAELNRELEREGEAHAAAVAEAASREARLAAAADEAAARAGALEDAVREQRARASAAEADLSARLAAAGDAAARQGAALEALRGEREALSRAVEERDARLAERGAFVDALEAQAS